MLFCSENEKCKIFRFFCPEKSSNPKIFLILNFSNSGQPSRLFMKMGLCDFSANLTPTDKNLNFTCKKMKKEKNGSKKSEKSARNKKKIEKKIDEKMIFLNFFEVPTAKNIFPARFFFFQIFISFFFFLALNSIPRNITPGSGTLSWVFLFAFDL